MRISGVRLTSRGNTLRERGLVNTQVLVLMIVLLAHTQSWACKVSCNLDRPKMVSEVTITFTQLVISQLFPYQNYVFLLVCFSFKHPDYKLQRPGGPGQPQTEVASSGFGNFLSSVTNYGNRNRDSQTLGVDGNLEISGPGLSQCYLSVDMPIEHLLCARC